VDSLNIFEDKPLEAPPPPPRRRRLRRPLWQILVAAGLVPGAGHLLLGKVQEGVAILLTTVVSQILATVAMAMGWTALSWVALRAGSAAYLYGVADAALLLYEMADGRADQGPPPPRRAAFWNLIGYGAGYELLEERTLALALGTTAALFHLGLSFVWAWAVVVGELLLLATASHAWWMATSQRRPRPDLKDTTPAWLRRSLVVSAVATLLLALASQWVALAWHDALQPERDEAVAMAPFYDNPHYGIHLEMPSPGWDFLSPSGDELFCATHLTENAALILKVAPRTLLDWDDQSWMDALLKDAAKKGWQLQVESSGPARLGSLAGWSVRAKGSYRGTPRTLHVVTATRGLQHITLWYEWAPMPDSFASTEMDQILASIELH